jgi:hypothetical protein
MPVAVIVCALAVDDVATIVIPSVVGTANVSAQTPALVILTTPDVIVIAPLADAVATG